MKKIRIFLILLFLFTINFCTTPSEKLPTTPTKKSFTPSSEKYTGRYDRYFKKYSKRYFSSAFDWKWFKSQAIAESNLREDAESWMRAQGIMQVMPKTFEYIKEKNPEMKDIHDPKWNIAAGIYYDRLMWGKWKAERPLMDRINFMFGSYNAGHNRIFKAQKICRKEGLNENLWDSIVKIAPSVPNWRHKETIGYVRKIGNFKKEL